MSDLFASNNLISIEVCYTVEKNRLGFPVVTILEDDEAAKMKADPAKKDKVRTLKSSWRAQSWKSANELLTAAQTWNFHANEFETDVIKHRNARLMNSLVDWDGPDVRDKDGNLLPCTPENINRMHVSIALALLNKYDRHMSPDPEVVVKN